ncbi:MAG: orotate phosphoribosyltransferase, partial [Bacteroidetes bacterium]
VPLKAAGLRVQDAVVLINRQQGGVQTLQQAGYKLHAAMTITYLLDVLEAHHRITSSQKEKVLKSLA